MPEGTIKFSIIIPTYNRADFIAKTIQSVLDQTYPNFELLVVDDGSKDNTREVVEAIQDPRVKYFLKENGERGAARNYGIKRAVGEYITFLDSDDLLYPFHFEEAMNVLEKYPDADVFHLSYEYVDTSGKVLSQKFHEADLNAQLVRGNLLSCIGVFVKNEILQQINFSENRALSGTEDWLLWLRLASRYKFYFSNRITASMINHEARSVLNFDEQEMLTRTELLLEGLQNDEHFMKTMGDTLKRIEAHMLSYISIHLLLSGKPSRAIYYFKQVFKTDLHEVFTRRTVSILVRLMLYPLTKTAVSKR